MDMETVGAINRKEGIQELRKMFGETFGVIRVERNRHVWTGDLDGLHCVSMEYGGLYDALD